MIDFYTLTSPNVIRVFIALEETKLPYNVKTVDIWKGEQFTPEFTQVNPNQKVPAIVDHDGPGGKPYTVIESGAILMYLADKTNSLLPADKAKRFDALQWMILQITSLGPMSGQLVHFSKFAPAGNDYGHSRYRTEVNRLFDLFDKRLADNAYLGGDEYSIADIAAFPWLRNVALLGIDMAGRPNIANWVAKVGERPAVKEALAKVATITSVRDSATEDNKDRLWGRGKYARA
jgi:GST-like protein